MWLQAKSRVMLSHPFLYLEPGPASVCRMESGRIHTWLPGAQRPKLEGLGALWLPSNPWGGRHESSESDTWGGKEPGNGAKPLGP